MNVLKVLTRGEDSGGGWDISNASYVQGFYVGSQDQTSQGVFFKPDGTKMYIVGSSTDSVYEYSLSSAWDISTASYVQSFSITVNVPFPYDLFFKPDGTTVYFTDITNDNVVEYSLSSAWDISTLSYVQSFNVGSQEPTASDVFFREDGLKMYVVGNFNDSAHEYSLSSAWDISTASFVQSLSLASITPNPSGIFFKEDGLKMFTVGTTSDSVHEYHLSSAWDISTASYVQSFYVGSQESTTWGLFFKPDGTKMFITGSVGDSVREYSL